MSTATRTTTLRRKPHLIAARPVIGTPGAANLARSTHRARSADMSISGAKKFRRIATEEAFSIPEVANALRDVARAPGSSLDLMLVKTIYDAEAGGPRAQLRGQLIDLEQQRLEGHGRERRRRPPALAHRTWRADVRRRHGHRARNDRERPSRRGDFSPPTRFAGLASFAPIPQSAPRRKWSARFASSS